MQILNLYCDLYCIKYFYYKIYFSKPAFHNIALYISHKCATISIVKKIEIHYTLSKINKEHKVS